jgi:DNA-binding transcriptional LysR family regulator
MIMRTRRFIPSISQLLAFEAVVRHQSVTIAAREMNLTQSTVTRLLQNLEGQVGQTLFIRERKRLVPTDAAKAYCLDISNALNVIQRASMGLMSNPDGGSLSLAVLPTFGTRWLAPRLAPFLQANPGITVNLATRVQRFSFDAESFDAVIFFGQANWLRANHMKLFDEHLTACASPDFLRRHPIESAAQVANLPLLQLETRPTAWSAWFEGQDATPPAKSGMLMDQFSMMIQAAISGLGIALLPDYLAWAEIAEGRLLPVLQPSVPGAGSYWLAWPDAKDRYGPLRAFRNWMATTEAPEELSA